MKQGAPGFGDAAGTAEEGAAEKTKRLWGSKGVLDRITIKSRNNGTVYRGTVEKICKQVEGGFVCETVGGSGVVRSIGADERVVVLWTTKTDSSGQASKGVGRAEMLYPADVAEIIA